MVNAERGRRRATDLQSLSLSNSAIHSAQEPEDATDERGYQLSSPVSAPGIATLHGLPGRSHAQLLFLSRQDSSIRAGTTVVPQSRLWQLSSRHLHSDTVEL